MGDNIHAQLVKALFKSAARGKEELVLRILHRRPNLVNATNIEGETALHVAAANGHNHIIKVMIKKGADLNHVDKCDRLTALRRAVMNGHHGIAGYLFKHGADVTITDSMGRTALHDCAERGILTLVRLILLKSPEICDVPDDNGDTPLALACLSKHTATASLLLDAGCDPYNGDSSGSETCMTSAVSSNRRSCKALLEEWDRVYSLVKARRTYDASDTLDTLCIHCFDDPPKETDDSPQTPAWLEDRFTGRRCTRESLQPCRTWSRVWNMKCSRSWRTSCGL